MIVFEKRPKEGESGKDLDKPKCGSCYNGKAPPSGCCNTCEEVHQAYQVAGMAFIEPDSIEQCVEERYVEQIKDQEGEGCRLIGRIRINKVAGNFHIMAGETIKRDKVHMHAMHHYYPQNYDFSHTINTLSFGETFEGQSNPLDKVSKSAPVRDVMYQYFVKVVGTELHYLNNTVLRSNQYSVTEHDNAEDAKNNAALLALLANQKSGFFVVFDISPMRIIYTQYKPSFTSFLSSSLAIIGSIFTVAGILDSFIFRAERAILAKHEIGKLH
ncbi:Endoplasmic reticulum-Golgi intermediate compartment protein 3 [Zancudomyces culisetae]|uniref:Endoplasmic reticulum-Golgi intermediate compartment protein 3 n=1 Tax=Zancudomyces culisetae TaxID=1213189 RepID=A0A1R1PDT2_ZANCU|nr:Endoplasmic reticulum-Golgi intermediate compartment protein 3 [Zancudomyces culisetae]OMH83569.1 Endoplasmic reticulum-Golgi intermediate compartment protein 3 [Zancudomyces culisetae]|eukprot:OMH79111.1 Endoplasmic reticulum-Golgi intermediate compartment protein 3 [Zancudomyces culisetae]